MTFYGNYDAGKAQGATTNPFVRRPEVASPQKFDINFPTTKDVKSEGSPWGVNLSAGVTPEKRIEEATADYDTALATVQNDNKNDLAFDADFADQVLNLVDPKVGKYYTESFASTSTRMAFGAYGNPLFDENILAS